MRFARFSFAALLGFVSIPALCQTYAIKSVTFSGYTASSQQELLAASGLNLAKPVSAADLQAAAQKLNDSGMFAHITYKFDGQTLAFQVEPQPGAVPARFDNFPWLDLKQIDGQLSAKLPLYKGQVIVGSGLERQVVDALTAIAAEQHLAASIVVTPQVELGSGRTTGDEFRMASPPVVISEVKLEGVAPGHEAPLEPVIKAAVDQEYSHATTPETLSTAIVNVYRNQGFLEAEVTLVGNDPPTVTPEKVSVPVKVTIAEGDQCRIGKFVLAGTVLTTQEEFSKHTLLKRGDIANQELLRRTLQSLSGPYRNQGYIRAKIGAVPTLDPAAHTVDYAINVTPGDQFHLGKLELAQASDEQRAKFMTVWKLKTGDPYDSSYVSSFLVKNRDLLHDFDGYSASYKQYEHEDTHVVDLVVTLQHGGSLH
jgi:outer membrane protein insertion porin family